MTEDYVKWDERLSVGVEQIDKQHQKWFSIINKLHSSMVSGESEKVMGEVLEELEDYTIYHFNTEEEYFRKFNYADAEAHINQHLMFIGNIKGFQNDFNSKKIKVSIDLLDFLKDWLINHISAMDKQYQKIFNEQGIR